MDQSERRKFGVRRDLNDLLRDESGRISGSKIGTYAGQIISGKLLLDHAEELIDHWDSLAIMFTVLIAPEIWRKFMAMKYGSGDLKTGFTEHKESITVSETKTKMPILQPKPGEKDV